MWVIEGPFDGEPGDLERKKLKLLKPSRSYPLGRKAKHPLQLVLSHPKVSAEQVTFVVGEHSVNSINDPAFRPTLTMLNHKNKALQVSRVTDGRKDRFVVEPLSEGALCSGDVVALVTGIYVSIHWRPVCCYAPPKTPSIAFDKCASLGVKVVSTPHPEVTHQLTATLSATSLVAGSLLALEHLVRPDWLTELLHLGDSSASTDSLSTLEKDFRLPAEAQHRPAFAASLAPQLKTFSLWEPSNKRVDLFKGWRFVFVGERGRELDIETRTLVERGRGEYETFDVSGGATRWRQMLSRNKRKAEAEGGKGLGVIGDSEPLKLAAGDSWDNMQDVLRSFGLRIMERATLINAVLYSDASRIDSSLVTDIDQESPLPDAVPNTHTDEQSFSSLPSANIVPPQDLEPAPRSRLGKRIAPSSRETTPAMDMKPTSVQPVAVLPEEQAAPLRASEEPEVSARKRLVRRARTNAAPPPILGVGDPSFLFSQTPELESLAVVPVADAPIVEKPSSSSSALITRSSRLKKRARAEAPLNPILANLEQEIAEATTQQPPLKRFKALFDETDPDRAASQVSGSGAFSGGIIDSQMFSQLPTESGGIGMSEPGLDAVPEEVEETLPEQVTRAREAGKVQVINDDLEDEGPLSPRKKQHKSASAVAVPTPSQTQKSHAPFSSTQDKVRASSKVGAAPGKPDTDAAFLKALASTKKGKRQEDDFDREFNQLRISKPELDNEAEDWRVLADFGDESNLMGNFMVIVEMDVPMSRASSRAQSKDPERSEWRGKQDFKKFKKKSSAYQRPCVQLVAEDGNDYGMGNAYWKGGSQGQSQSDAVSQNELGTAQQPALSKPSQTRNRGFLEPASGPSTLNANPRSRSQSQSRAKTSQAKTQKSGLRSKSRSLQVVSEEESDDDRQPEKNGKAGANGKAKGKNEPLFLEEESVEDVGGAVLGGEEIDVDLDLDLDLDGVSDEDFGEPMLRSTAKPDAAVIKSMSSKATVASKRSATSKKRSSALMDDDDSDTGMAFKGFTGRKKAKAY